jgi:transcriptional regulator with XRE-family HTH domain
VISDVDHITCISAKEEMSSLPNEGRAKISEIADINIMEKNDWRGRLQKILSETGKSAREVSLAAGKGPGYIHSIIKEGKDPTIDNLIAICGVLNISLSRLIYGYELSSETEEILALLEGSPNSREGILKILRDKAGS